MFMYYIITVSVCCLSSVSFAYFGSELTAQHLKFLQDKGYLDPPDPYSGALKTQDEIVKSLKKFQAFAGIPTTGKIDDETITKFNQARCGMKDVHHLNDRMKRYVLQGNKWDKKVLTYQIKNYSPDLSRHLIHRTIKKALSRWEAASQLRFYEKKTGEADIIIKFSRKNHNDPYPFDGVGGTLAHAFYPGDHVLAGDTHFDDDETFTLKSKTGKNLYWVALHEFGHAVGLDHNNLKGTVMYPWYERYSGHDVDLSNDDKRGLQYLYGRPDKRDVPTDSDKPLNKLCVKRVNIILNGQNSQTIVINDDKVYIFDGKLKMKEGPLSLSEYYPGLTAVDTAFKQRNGNTVFIYGASYWEYNGRRRMRGPEHVSRIGFTKDMYDLNAAFRWERNRKVYMFKGKQYWRYDDYRNRVDPGYPKQIKDGWVGVPENFNSAFQWKNEKVYFFKGSKYYRYDDRRFEIHKSYPQSIEKFLLCQSTHRFSRYAGRNTRDIATNSFSFPTRSSMLFVLFMVVTSYLI